MLEIVIPEQHHEPFDEWKEEFLPKVDVPKTKLQLEHSLLSLKKWESKWNKPFLSQKEITGEELADYVRCMTLTHGVNPIVYQYIPAKEINTIIEYIQKPMTATWFRNDALVGAQKNSREVVTAEIIYYWMISLNIPVEFQKWHLNQLLTLIKVVNIKNSKPVKKSKADAARERAALNRKRREAYNSRG